MAPAALACGPAAPARSPYHDVALEHLQAGGAVGLQQSVHHILQLVFLLIRADSNALFL